MDGTLTKSAPASLEVGEEDARVEAPVGCSYRVRWDSSREVFMVEKLIHYENGDGWASRGPSAGFFFHDDAMRFIRQRLRARAITYVSDATGLPLAVEP